MRRCRGCVAAVCVLLVGLAAPAAALGSSPPASALGFGFDGLGRLIEASDPSGSTAFYNWDAVGNLSSITDRSSSSLSVAALVPQSGAVGSTVGIFGTGFSASAGQDAVTFNGTSASVSQASESELVVSVPSGASSGTVTVTVSGSSASSASSFSVTGSRVPTIASVSTSLAAPGSSLMVTGTSFDTTATNDTLGVNLTRAAVSSATATSLSSTVPASAGSGPVRVATADGLASGPDLFIPPPGFSVSSVAQTARISLGSPEQVSIGTAGGVALLIFDGTAGQQVSVNLTNASFSIGELALYDPYNNLITQAQAGSPGFIDATRLPTTGTYTVLVAASGSSTGTGTLTASLITTALYTVSPSSSGSAANVSTSVAQDASISFSGTSGERVSIMPSGWSYPGVCPATGTLYNPDGTTYGVYQNMGMNCNGGNPSFIGPLTLSQTGTYTFFFDPPAQSGGSATLTFYALPADPTYQAGTLSGSGTAVNLSTPVPGQNASVTFTASAGEQISITTTNWSYHYFCNASATLLNPDGSTFKSYQDIGGNCNGGGPSFIEETLSQTGTYTLYFYPNDGDTGGVSLTFYQVPTDASYQAGALTSPDRAVGARVWS